MKRRNNKKGKREGKGARGHTKGEIIGNKMMRVNTGKIRANQGWNGGK
jgi:hypothetical protein